MFMYHSVAEFSKLIGQKVHDLDRSSDWNINDRFILICSFYGITVYNSLYTGTDVPHDHRFIINRFKKKENMIIFDNFC